MKIPFPAGEEPLQKILCIFPSIKIFIGWSEFLFFFVDRGNWEKHQMIPVN